MWPADSGFRARRHLRDGLRPRIEVDEHERGECLDANRPQSVIAFVETGDPLGVGRAAQAPIEGVGPGVVAARERRGLAAARLDQAVAAVLAHVVKRTQCAVPACDHEHALFENVMGDERAGLLQLIDMGDQMPGV